MHKIIKDIFTIFNDHYTKVGDYSATELINPPRVVTLKNRYPECSKDIFMIRSAASLFGSGVHSYIEKLLKPYDSKYQLEQRLQMKLMDKKLSGTYDILVDNKDMYDIKTCKAWKLIFDPEMKDWHEQQNIYAWMIKQIHGIELKSINIIAMYLDWMVGNAMRSKSYPQEPIIVYPLKLWPYEKTEHFIINKLQELITCEDIPDDELPPCTREERWEKFPEGVTKKYAVMKNKDAKRAARILLSKEDTIQYCKENKGLNSASYVEIRYAERKRCETYCEVNNKCNHYLTYKKDIENDTLFDIVPMDLILNGKWI
jgi:hypothetical protein